MKKLTIVSFLVLFTGSSVFSQVGINSDGSSPDSSAGLDINFPNKGLLIPQVALLGTDDAATVPTPATSLLVYNTATAGTIPNNVVPGYYYNAGTPASPVWTRLATDPIFNNGSAPHGLIIKLSNTASYFGQEVPEGSILVDQSTDKAYLTLVTLASTDNIILCLPLGTKIKEISNATHTGDVFGTANSDVLTIADSAVTTNKIADKNVTYDKLEDMPANSLLGNSMSSGTPSNIAIGAGLSISNNTLYANGAYKVNDTYSPISPFGQEVPIGTILIDISTGKEYLALVPLYGFDNIFGCIAGNRIKEISNVTHSGEVFGSANSDVLTIANGAVTSDKILDGTIATADLGVKQVTYDKLEDLGPQSLLGNSMPFPGMPTNIAIGTGLGFSGNTLYSIGVRSFTFTDQGNGVNGTVSDPTGNADLQISLSDITPTSIMATTNITTSAGNITAINGNITAGGQISSNVIGVPPLVVASNLEVPNLRSATATNISGGNSGSVPYQTSANTTAMTAPGSMGTVLTTTDAMGNIGWRNIPTSGVQNLTVSAGAFTFDPALGNCARLTVSANNQVVNMATPSTPGASGFIVANPNNIWSGFRLLWTGGTSYYAADLRSTALGVVNGDGQVRISGTNSSITGKPSLIQWFYDGVNMFWGNSSTGYVL